MLKKRINIDIVASDIYVTLTKKKYEKTLQKHFNVYEEMVSMGRTTILEKNGMMDLVVGIQVERISNIVEAKGLLVHELSHVVTEIMNHHGFNCDEFRSYCLQKLYIESVTMIDEYYANKKN